KHRIAGDPALEQVRVLQRRPQHEVAAARLAQQYPARRVGAIAGLYLGQQLSAQEIVEQRGPALVGRGVGASGGEVEVALVDGRDEAAVGDHDDDGLGQVLVVAQEQVRGSEDRKSVV